MKTESLPVPTMRGMGIPASCLHKVFRTVEKLERKNGRSLIRLHVGEPYFKPPPEVPEAFALAIRQGYTAYTAVEGLQQLRQLIVEKLNKKNRISTTMDRVFVTPGSTQGLSAIVQAIWVPGAEMLIPEIHWPIHLQQCLLAGFRPIFYPLGPEFNLDPDALLSAASPHTKVLLVNTPANPTGAVCTAEILSRVLELAQRNDWIVISDEAYEDFVYEGQHCSIGSLESNLPEHARRVFSVFTFSKSYAMTGYRLGYLVVPNARSAKALKTVQEATIIAPCTPVQFAGMAALHSCDCVNHAAIRLKEIRDRCLAPLLELGIATTLPKGGWYMLLDLKERGISADQFSRDLLYNKGVAVSPADGFALREHITNKGTLSWAPDPKFEFLVRIAFCGEPSQVEEGIARIKQSFSRVKSIHHENNRL